MKKLKVGIIGTGNIGTDLLFKVQKSNFLECTIFTGQNENSKGIEVAKEMGIFTSSSSIQAIVENPEICSVVFDATSAKSHIENAKILKKLNMFTIDLTPAKVGKMCIPVINMEESMKYNNINMITCGGQATIPIAYAISELYKDDISYMEIVASISSKSAGMGTRNNIDEFTQTTKDALSEFTGVKKTKAIIILNPASPEIIMRNTLYCYLENPDMDKIKESVKKMVGKVQEYVPGYHLVVEPIYENNRVTTIVEVIGSGDYLPKYAGNLDIITCAAISVAEEHAKSVLGGQDE